MHLLSLTGADRQVKIINKRPTKIEHCSAMHCLVFNVTIRGFWFYYLGQLQVQFMVSCY